MIEGEINSVYPKLDLTILSGASRLLPRLTPKNGATAEKMLASKGVKAVHDVKVESTQKSGSQTIIKLSDGTTKTVDIYIDATGSRPNSGYLPKDWLNEKGYVKTEDIKTLRTPIHGVYAIGDVASYSTGGVLDIIDAVRPLGTTILADLMHDEKKQKPFAKTVKETQFVPIGPKGGVGVLFGWRVPSFMVWLIKSRNYMIDSVPPTIAGEPYKKA